MASETAVEQVTIRIGGKPYRCDCGCNVFTKLPGPPFLRFECNGCHARYTGATIEQEEPSRDE